MENLQCYSDKRLRGFCAFCGGSTETLDHVPSRIFLDEPYPADLPGVRACEPCNNGVLLDEEYLACLIECVVTDRDNSAEPRRPKIARIFACKPKFESRIRRARQQVGDEFLFTPEYERVNNIVVKLARGQAMFELSQPQLGEPKNVTAVPLISFSPEQRAPFETVAAPAGWPEVGSRALRRLLIREADECKA